nr:syncytin-1-like [Gorilla gorilla gorilla]
MKGPPKQLKAVKLQMVPHMEPQMQSMTKIYHRALDRPVSPCSDVDDIKGTPSEEISTARPYYAPIQQEAVKSSRRLTSPIARGFSC